MSSKEMGHFHGDRSEKKRTIHDISQLDPKFREVFDTYPWVAEDLQLLIERSPWKFEHTVRVGQIALALARHENTAEPELATLTVASMLHDIAMVDDDLVDLTNTTVSLEGDELRFLIEEHPRRAAERYANRHADASLLIGNHSKKPTQTAVPDHLRKLHAYLYLSDQVDARMSDRPYRTVAETQTGPEVLAALSADYPETFIQVAISTHGQLYKKSSLPHAA